MPKATTTNAPAQSHIQLPIPTDPDRLPGSESLYFLPEEIEVEEIGDRIPLPAAEEERLTRDLAETIKEVGQEQPCKVFLSGDQYRLFIGRRRRNAIALINAEMGKNDKPMRVWCVVEEKGDSYRKAVIENVHRRNYSPIEFSNIILRTKAEKGWSDKSWAEKEGQEYFHVSPALLRETARLQKLPEDIKAKVHVGELTTEGAFTLLREVKDAKRQEVAEEADRLAAEEHRKRVAKEQANPTRSKAAKKKIVQSKPRTAKKHVRQAARKIADSTDRPAIPSKIEIIEFFEGQDGPAFGHENGDVRMFLAKFSAWARCGEGSERVLDKLFTAMVAKADPGSKTEGAKLKSDAKPVKSAAVSKGRTKPKAKPKAKAAA